MNAPPSHRATQSLAATPAPLPSLDGLGAVMIDGHSRAISVPLARDALERGIPVVLDVESPRCHTDKVLAVADIAVVSEDFASLGLDDARLGANLAHAAEVAGRSLGSFGTRRWLGGLSPSGPAT